MNVNEFLDIHSSELGLAPSNCEAINLINKARDLVYTMGDYTGTTGYATINIETQCAYLPYNLETLRRAYTGCKNIIVENSGYCSVANDFCKCGCDPVELFAVKTNQQNVLPYDTFSDRNYYFRNHSSKDDGKKVVIRYTDGSGTERNEEVVLSSDNDTKLGYPVNRVSILRKDRTFGMVGMYSNDGTLIHKLYPNEINPRYSKYSFSGCLCDCVVLYGKKRFIPYIDDDYDRMSELDIPTHGLLLAIKAIKSLSGEKEDLKYYANYVKLAGDYLKQEKKDKEQSSQGTHKVEWNPNIPLGVKC